MATTYLSNTFSSPTNNKIWTMSAWIKRGSPTAEEFIMSSSASYREFIRFESTGELAYRKASGSSTFEIKTSMRFLDTNAWYHVVVAVDTTQSTNANKVKIYANGVQQTSFATASYMATDYTPQFNGAHIHTIGRDSESAGGYWLGSMSHFHFCDGTQLAPTVFGETDSTTGEWKINTSPSFTLGNNGFSILKDANTVTDQSSNSNDWTVAGGTLTKTLDNPSNNFATFNPLLKTPSALSYLNGNTTVKTTNSQWEGSISTIAPSSGKWYWEARYNTGTGIKLDIVRQPADLRFFDNSNQAYGSYNTNGYGYQLNNSGTDYYCNNNT